jgi:hypothetical protein
MNGMKPRGKKQRVPEKVDEYQKCGADRSIQKSASREAADGGN